MPLWTRAARVVAAAEDNAQLTRAAAPAAASLSIPTYADWAGVITEESAKRIPAFLRGLRLISGTVAQLPLIAYRDGAVSRDQPRLLQQPEPDVARWITLQRTAEDLVCHGRAYWRIRDTTSQNYPRTVEQLDALEVGDDRSNDPHHVHVGGLRVPKSDPTTPTARAGDVIAFYGFDNGVLHIGATVLQTAIALEEAVQRYAETPLPTMALKNTGADLPADQVNALLDAWEKARATRSTAYLNAAVDTETYGWDAAQIQLVEARNQAAVQIARLLGLDPMWVGANIPGGGSTLTYTNRVDLRKDFVDLTVGDYLTVIEQRLSMRDITPTFTNNHVAFDVSEFLRSSLERRTEMVATLLPLGVLTVDEARDFLEYSPTRKGGLV